jgi:Flp pilus assembly pilin Flp
MRRGHGRTRSHPLMTSSRDTQARTPARRRIARDESGAAMVEFALVLPLLLLVLFGLIDFGRGLNYWIDETHLANMGARWAAVDRNPGPGTTLQESIRRRAETAELREGGSSSIPDPLQVCITFPDGTSAVGDPVKIDVKTTYDWLSYLDAKSGLTQTGISGSATMRIERAPSSYSAGCSS